MHRSLEALGRGRSGESLRSFVDAVAVEEELDAEHAEELFPLIERTAATDAWKALIAAGAPRATPAPGTREHDAAEGRRSRSAAGEVTLAPDGWKVVDWKTDTSDGAGRAERRERYARQVDAYVKMLTSLTSPPASRPDDCVAP